MIFSEWYIINLKVYNFSSCDNVYEIFSEGVKWRG